jgi:hypothetical protein
MLFPSKKNKNKSKVQWSASPLLWKVASLSPPCFQSLALHSTPPLPSRGEFHVLCLWCSVLLGGRKLQSTHELHWIMWFPWGWLVCGLTCWGCRFTPAEVSPGRVYVDCVCVIWVQYVSESISVCSAVFHFFQEKKKWREKKKGNHLVTFPNAERCCAGPSLHWDFPSCYGQLKAVSSISRGTLHASYVLAVI